MDERTKRVSVTLPGKSHPIDIGFFIGDDVNLARYVLAKIPRVSKDSIKIVVVPVKRILPEDAEVAELRRQQERGEQMELGL